MTPAFFLGLFPVLLGFAAVQPGMIQESVTRLVVQDEVILRVPVQARPFVPQIDWIEHKGPKCVPVSIIRRAILSGEEQIDQVDFVLADRTRIRAKLDEDCPALDFYGGFYLQPQDDRLCVHRDSIHSRIGGSCTIEQFRQLEPRFRH